MTDPRQREEPLFLPDPEPEGIVIVVRAVCGAVAGLFVAGVVWLNFLYDELDTVPTILWFAGMSAWFAYWTVRRGDAFWERWMRNPFWR
jgi:hypothetical protein